MKIYTKQEVSEILIDINNKNGGINESLINKSGISRRPVRTHFGSISNAIKELNLKHLSKKPKSLKGTKKTIHTKEDILLKIKNIESKYGYFSKSLIDVNGPEYGVINHKVINRIWGSFRNLYKEESIKERPNNKGLKIIPDDYYISTIKNYCEQNLIKELSSTLIRKICSKNNISTKTLTDRFDTLENFSNILNIKYVRNKYIGEELAIKYVSNILNEEPVLQYRTESVKNVRKMPIDAYFPKNNIALEYNGEQHYMYVKKFHKGRNSLESQIKRDKIKHDAINNAGMKLLIISYNDSEDDIKSKLMKLL